MHINAYFLTESMASMNSGKAARTPLLPALPLLLVPLLLFGLFVLPWALSSGRQPCSKGGAGTDTATPTEVSVIEPRPHV